jgi:phage terminase large subunit
MEVMTMKEKKPSSKAKLIKPTRKVIDLSTQERERQLLEQMRDPVWYSKNVLQTTFWKMQREIVRSVLANKKTTVKASHGVGKSFLASNTALVYAAMYKPSIVITTAPSNRQVEGLIWQEIRRTLYKTKEVLKVEIMPSASMLYMLDAQGNRVPKWYIHGFSTTDPDKFQGIHEDRLLLVCDEAAGLSDKLFPAFESITNLENNRLLLIGNPTSISGGFYNSFKDPRYTKFTISNYISPNFTAMGITENDIITGNWEDKYNYWMSKYDRIPFPFLADPKDTAEKYKAWCPNGVKTSIYISRIEGEFVAADDDSLFPMNWIELAFERWNSIKRFEGKCELGIDVAYSGNDESSIAVRYGSAIKEFKKYKALSPTELARVAEGVLKENDIKAIAKIDANGIGAGTESMMCEDGYDTRRVMVQGGVTHIAKEDPKATTVKDLVARKLVEQGEGFANLRAQMFWYLRMRLDPDTDVNPEPIALPPSENLLQEMMAIGYKQTGKGRIQITDKIQIKKDLGRSPDMADSLALAFCPEILLEGSKKVAPKIWTITH